MHIKKSSPPRGSWEQGSLSSAAKQRCQKHCLPCKRLSRAAILSCLTPFGMEGNAPMRRFIPAQRGQERQELRFYWELAAERHWTRQREQHMSWGCRFSPCRPSRQSAPLNIRLLSKKSQNMSQITINLHLHTDSYLCYDNYSNSSGIIWFFQNRKERKAT